MIVHANLEDKRRKWVFAKISDSFCHYTTLDSLDAILKSKSLRLSKICNSNDNNENNEEGSTVYIFSFCASDSEKIPLWYLYSGIEGNGARLRITRSKLLNILKKIEIKDADKNVIDCKEYELKLGYLYYKKDDSSFKFRNKWYKISDNENFDKNSQFIKDYPWEYEKEFRIVIKYTGKKDMDHIFITIPDDVYKALDIMYAPEIKDNEIDTFTKTEGYAMYLKAKIGKSKLKIGMNLYERNIKSLHEKFKKDVCPKCGEKSPNYQPTPQKSVD